MNMNSLCRSSAAAALAALFIALSLPASAAPRTYEVSVTGPGGHSYGSYGQTNAVHAAARTVMEIEKRVPSAVIAEMQGGVSVNAIAADARIRILADEADAEKIAAAVDAGCAAENAFRGVKPGDKTSGGAPADIRCSLK